MRRKMRLKKRIKIILTIILLVSALFIYLKTGIWGELAQNSKFYENLSLFSWFWLFMQPFALTMIWEMM